MGCEVVLIAVCSVFLHVMGRVFVHMLCLVSGVCAAVSLPVCASALGICVLWWIVMSVECVVGLLFEVAWLSCFLREMPILLGGEETWFTKPGKRK